MENHMINMACTKTGVMYFGGQVCAACIYEHDPEGLISNDLRLYESYQLYDQTRLPANHSPKIHNEENAYHVIHATHPQFAANFSTLYGHACNSQSWLDEKSRCPDETVNLEKK